MKKFWLERILQPQLADEALQAKLADMQKSLPIPVFWLLGKTQSGKSSIIQALTGSPLAVVGEGFRPCTRQTTVFNFPNPESPILRFLDTQGLGEVAYDPQEDLQYCQTQAHLLMLVTKALDQELEALLATLATIHAAHPDWPILVVQTCLHEGYPSKATEHLEPYPYADTPLPAHLPPDLSRALLVQRQRFKAYPQARFVAIDFTQAQDGYQPVQYGLLALWTEIEHCLPLGLQHMLLQNQEQLTELNDIYSQTAHPHIIAYAISAGVLALTPLPAVSIPLVLTIQGKLFHSIASIYGLTLTSRSVSEVASAIGMTGLGSGLVARELAKLVPGWGSVVSGLSTAAITYALGRTFCVYYAYTRQGKAFSASLLKTVYQEQLQRGRDLLKERFK